MERVISFSSFEEDDARNDSLEYWLSRTPEERLAEVERLRREYMVAFCGIDPDTQRLSRTLRILDRWED